MKVKLGIDQYLKQKHGKDVIVEWDPDKLVNPHILLIGMSGSGKTYTLRRIVNNMVLDAETTQKSEFRINIFDIHGDIKAYKESVLMYSESTNYGINPLALSPDPHFGGVRKKIEQFLYVLQRSTRALGEKQSHIIRKSLEELYLKFGFKLNDHNTWSLDQSHENNSIIWLNIPYEQINEAKKYGARWNPEVKSWYIDKNRFTEEAKKVLAIKPQSELPKRRYPNLIDFKTFLKEKMETAFLGTDEKTTKLLRTIHQHNKKLKRLQYKIVKEKNTLDDEALGKLECQIEALSQEAITSFENYVHSRPTGKSLEEIMKYKSYEEISSVFNRIENLASTGIFKDDLPPFDYDCYVHRHILKPLNSQEQKMFVLFSAEKIFEECVRKGETKELREVIVLDEASNFFDDSQDNILSKIALEGRKFGIALICASQSPTHFSQDYLGSVATKIVLGLDETYWGIAKRKLNIDEIKLKMIAPRQSLISQMKYISTNKAPWKSVEVVR